MAVSALSIVSEAPVTALRHPPLSLSLTPDALADYVARQLGAFFPDGDESQNVKRIIGATLERLEYCLGHIRLKGYWRADGPAFNHRHTDQYATFLYFLANTAHRKGLSSLAAKAYALNKALHAFEAFYEVELPEIFVLMHPVGTVLGRATYKNYFFVYQNVTVGADPTFGRPTFGEGVALYGGSRVIGNATVGANCLISAGATLLGGTVPDNHVAFGTHPDVRVKPTRYNVIRDIFQNT